MEEPCGGIRQCREATAAGVSGRKHAPPHDPLFPPQSEKAATSPTITSSGTKRSAKVFGVITRPLNRESRLTPALHAAARCRRHKARGKLQRRNPDDTPRCLC